MNRRANPIGLAKNAIRGILVVRRVKSMTNMNISLPYDMKAFVEAQMAQDGYASASEYLRALIREDQKRRAKRELEAKILKGLQGPAVVLDRAEWDSIRREALEGLAGEDIRP
jgi:antitoxin ParD1/3/4